MSTLLAVSLLALQFAQASTGELHLLVTDPAGLPVPSAVELISEANQVRESLQTSDDGRLVARRLPFGRYRIAVSRDGFALFTGLVDIQSSLPTDFRVTLGVAPIQAQVTVNTSETLLDLRGTSTTNRIGAELAQRRLAALPGRSIPELVNTQPGWLLEANGVLHPRGSEYQVQYVVDGLPLTDNRSPSFAPELGADEVHAMTILTGGYPAEYGRKLGGVIEVVTAGQAQRGAYSTLVLSGGSFDTATGYGSTQYGWTGGSIGGSASVGKTNRYLDPPVEEPVTNHGTTSELAAHVEQELSASDRVGAIVRYGRAGFVVPNELVQEKAGQRQDRSTRETSGQFSYQRLFTSATLVDVRGLVRDLTAALTSNERSTPILAYQDRGLRETYVKATVATMRGRHEWKLGGDVVFGSLRESFRYQITDAASFAPGTLPSLTFDGRSDDREQALFVQDQMRLGAITVTAGLRWDHYRLLVSDSAISPRLGIAWAPSTGDLVVRASYDRAFQTPATENLLLASAGELDALGEEVVRFPVRPSRGHFFDVGLSKRLFGALRVDVTQFARRMTQFADDDVLLNTGVSFPIAFDRARIHGTELKVDVPRWRALSGSFNYAYMKGRGYLPITGGLLLDDDLLEPSDEESSFPISQDQRHTVRGRASYQLPRRTWVSVAGTYGSGLPVEEFDGDRDEAEAQFGPRIVDRVDFDRGRLRPSFTVDASAGIVLVQRDTRRVRVQADVLNVTNRLNVINFAGLFSGTALAPPRAVAVRVQAEF